MFLHNLLNIIVQIANKMGLQKKTNVFVEGRRAAASRYYTTTGNHYIKSLSKERSLGNDRYISYDNTAAARQQTGNTENNIQQ
jgi:hypothetical protein